MLLAAVAAGVLCGEARAEPLRIKMELPQPSEYNLWLRKQIQCVRDAIYTEARGESDYGKLMVAYVVVNRWKTRPQAWGNSPCQVVYQIGLNKRGGLVSQFSGPIHHPVVLPDTDPELMRAAVIAIRVLLGYELPQEEHRCSIAYQRIEHADSKRQTWFTTLRSLGKIDNHTHYCLPETRMVSVASR
jgi:hypothetical protein